MTGARPVWFPLVRRLAGAFALVLGLFMWACVYAWAFVGVWAARLGVIR